MAHAPRDHRIKPFEDLKRGRGPGRGTFRVPKEAYPEMARMDEEGYLMSEIGRRFHVTGPTAGRIIKRYRASGLSGNDRTLEDF